MEPNRSRWAGRFIGAAIIQGAIAFAILGVLIGISALQLNPSPGRIVAGGDTCSVTITNQTAGTGTATCSSAGMWLGVGMSALFYQHLEVTLGAVYTGWRNFVAWLHLLLGGVGASAGTLVMAYGGYMGGAALLPVSSGGLGKNAFYVHTNILNPLAPYITALLGIALLGFFLGGIGYVTAWRSARKN